MLSTLVAIVQLPTRKDFDNLVESLNEDVIDIYDVIIWNIINDWDRM